MENAPLYQKQQQPMRVAEPFNGQYATPDQLTQGMKPITFNQDLINERAKKDAYMYNGSVPSGLTFKNE
jgi:hypothetical protein